MGSEDIIKKTITGTDIPYDEVLGITILYNKKEEGMITFELYMASGKQKEIIAFSCIETAVVKIVKELYSEIEKGELIITKDTFKEATERLNQLASKSFAYVDEIPFAFKRDFQHFIVGKGLSTHMGRVVTYDLKEYYNKICYGEGLPYRVLFQTEPTVKTEKTAS